MLITRLSDKTGSLGAIASAMGCASCFPAIASIGSALGLGFLADYEGLFLDTLLPVFAGIALLANLFTGITQRRWLRLLLGIAGPLMVFATLYLFWSDNWSTYMFYTGLALMLGVSIWDFISPARHTCATKIKASAGEELA